MIARTARWLFGDKRQPRDFTTTTGSGLEWARIAPFAGLHLGFLAVPWVGVSPVALATAVALYLARMFFITAFYHRYFSHRAFRASRPLQFVMGALGCTAGQRGPLWWAGHHRQHHASADTLDDPHSPTHRGLLTSHLLWFFQPGTFAIREERVRDWLRYPELVWLERFDWVAFLALGAACYGFGAALEAWRPSLGTNGVQMLVWGFFVSTVVLYHATYTINSLAHRFGRRRYETGDQSRNNLWLALLTLGEGWHNNHHYYPAAARQGFYWWEVDPCYLLLKALAALGLISDLRPVPAAVLAAGRARGGAR